MEHRDYYSDRYYSNWWRRRSKSDWAGVATSDAFRSNLDYDLRRPAQRLYYHLLKQILLAIVRLIDPSIDAGFGPKVKPQLGPVYTSYPASVAVWASFGLTGYLEYQARVKPKLMLSHMADYLKNPAENDQVRVDPDSYREVAKIVTETVEVRLLLEDLSRLPMAASVETYRLFQASQQSLRFDSLPEIIRCVVLFGDVLPDWRSQRLHDMTRSILIDVTKASAPFAVTLRQTKSHQLLALGTDWVKAVCRRLVQYLPGPEMNTAVPRQSVSGPGPQDTGFTKVAQGETRATGLPDFIPPLNANRPPSLFEEQNPLLKMIHAEVNRHRIGSKTAVKGKEEAEKEPADPWSELINEFAKTVDQAGGQTQNYEDMRSDLVEQASRSNGFKESPIQGNPTDGHSVSVDLGNNEKVKGEIFDRAIGLSEDLFGHEALEKEARPLTDELLRTLYPNSVQLPETERLRTSGSLDPARLPLADVCSAVFRRYTVVEQPDKRGQPVFVLICDFSGSLGASRIRMLKNLSFAWLTATIRRNIQVLAAIYNTESIRSGLYGPLVQWLYHPRKTPATGPKEATRALLSLPNSGSGGQSDALSIAFVMNEAAALARGRRIYMVLITDCGWCNSFNIGKSAKEEVFAYFQSAYMDLGDRLHATLVALEVSGQTGFENLLDKVIPVTSAELNDPVAVAGKIGLYVAACMKERRRMLTRR